MANRLSTAYAGLLVITMLCSAPGPVQSQAVTVGAEGEVYTILEGTYGELFPDQAALVDTGHPVLALDIAHPDTSRERLLVPGTGSADTEDSASLVFEDQSETLFVLWQTKVSIHSYLNLTSFRDGTWSPVAEILGSPFGWKTSPQLTVTRDVFRTLDDGGEPRTWNRTVVHVVWGEEQSDGLHTLYSPIVLLDGSYLGSSPVYDLSSVGAALGGEPELLAVVPPSLASAARIQTGRNAQTVVIGFADPASGRLVTLELEVLPGEVHHLADRLGHQIIDIGRKLRSSEPEAFADQLGHQIIDIGRTLGLHPGLTGYASAVVQEAVLDAPPEEPLEHLAERLGHQIIDIGARMTGRGLDRTLSQSGYLTLEVQPEEPEGDSASSDPSHVIRASMASSRSLPPIEDTESSLRFFLSRTGVDVIVAWETEKGLEYLESQDEAWSETFQLHASENGVISVERAWEMLRLRAQGLHHEAP